MLTGEHCEESETSSLESWSGLSVVYPEALQITHQGTKGIDSVPNMAPLSGGQQTAMPKCYPENFAPSLSLTASNIVAQGVGSTGVVHEVGASRHNSSDENHSCHGSESHPEVWGEEGDQTNETNLEADEGDSLVSGLEESVKVGAPDIMIQV